MISANPGSLSGMTSANPGSADASVPQQVKLAPATNLTSVTVFRDGARVTRQFEIDLETKNGVMSADVLLKGLPIACRRDSFHIRAFSNDSGDKVSLTDLKTDTVRIRRNDLVVETAAASAVSNDSFFSTMAYLETLRNNLDTLENKHEEIELEINRVQMDQECVLKHAENYLQLTPPAKIEATEDEGLELAEASRAANFVATLTPLLHFAKETEELKKSRRQLKQDIQLIKEELQRLAPYVPWNPAKVESTKTELRMLAEYLELVDVLNISFKLQFFGLPATSLQLEIVYVVGNSTWKPEYTIHANSSAVAPGLPSEGGAAPCGAAVPKTGPHKGISSAYLVGYGVITQDTGEDWSNLLDLWVSSASIDEVPIPSELPPQVVTVKPVSPPVPSYHQMRQHHGGSGHQKRGMMARAMALPATPGPETFGVCAAQATVDEVATEVCQPLNTGRSKPYFSNAASEKHGFNVVYNIPGRSTVRTGKQGTRVPIVEGSFPCGLVRVCVPSRAESVFLEGKMRNTSNTPWLATDKVALYLDGIYVGSASSFTSNVFPSNFLSLGFGLDRSTTAKHSGEVSYDSEKLMFAGKTKQRKMKASTIITVSNQNARDGFAQIPIIVISPLPLSRETKISVTVEYPSNRIEITNAGDDIEAVWQLAKHWSTNSNKIVSDGPLSLAAINKSTNHILQLVELGPGPASTTVETCYSVMWPVGKEITTRTRVE